MNEQERQLFQKYGKLPKKNVLTSMQKVRLSLLFPLFSPFPCALLSTILPRLLISFPERDRRMKTNALHHRKGSTLIPETMRCTRRELERICPLEVRLRRLRGEFFWIQCGLRIRRGDWGSVCPMIGM